MKVTVCFDDVKVIVPCGNDAMVTHADSFMKQLNFRMIDATASENETTASIHSTLSSVSSSLNSISKYKEIERDSLVTPHNQTRVSDVIEKSILKYKKATGKVSFNLFSIINIEKQQNFNLNHLIWMEKSVICL